MMDGGLCERSIIRADKLHPSDQLSYDQLALVETLAIGCHASDRGKAKKGDHALVIGAGPIGLSTIEFNRLTGATLTIMDMSEERLEFCRKNYGIENLVHFKGDGSEIEAMKEVFKDKVPPFSSTKSITGHSLGATSVQEAIYCLLMMKNKFIAASANVKDLDEKVKGLPIVTEVKKNVDLNCVMSNSFGFGGTNATLIFEKI
mgnify:CR=1 FL=1